MNIKKIIGLFLVISLLLGGLGTAFPIPAEAAMEPSMKDVAYANQSKAQKLDVYLPKATGTPTPVVIFVHGGAWTGGDKIDGAEAKPEYLTSNGYACVSVNYRMHPEVDYESMAADVATAVKWVKDNAASLNIDTGQMHLMGHSAGGHLVSLVASDKRFLEQAGLSLADIRSVVNLDGTIYVPAAIIRLPYIAQVFGTDKQVQIKASPLTYANQPSLPPYLMVTRDVMLNEQPAQRNDELRKNAGNISEMFFCKELEHGEINMWFGDPHGSQEAEKMTAAIMDFLKRQSGDPQTIEQPQAPEQPQEDNSFRAKWKKRLASWFPFFNRNK